MTNLLEKLETNRRNADKIESLFSVGPQYGYTASANSNKVGPKFLRITDIQGNVVEWDKVPYCEISSSEKSKYILEKDDLVFARTGASTGMSYLVDADLREDAVFASYLIRLRFDKNKCDPRFLKYFFQSWNYWGQVRGSLSGSAQPGINAVTLSQLIVNIPDVATQKKIAEILGAYDAKIENNNAIIKNLEAMAQAIFNEWFVKFRYPGYEKVKMVDSELGLIPEGWEVENISDFCDAYGGGTPNTKDASFWKDGNVFWATPTDMTALSSIFIDKTDKKITSSGIQHSSASILPVGTILMTSRATVGVLAISMVPISTNQGFVSCVCKKAEDISYFFWWLKNNVRMIKDLATGSTFPEISRGVFRNIVMYIPSDKIRVRFHDLISPMHDQIYCLQKENITLKESRDRLLAELIK